MHTWFHLQEGSKSLGVDALVEHLIQTLEVPKRDSTGKFLMAVDHCFPIRGQGTVLTGTVLSGSVQLNDMVEIPELKLQRKIKSMQMFHRPVNQAIQVSLSLL
jgi:selenocysteine-specific elongation factor